MTPRATNMTMMMMFFIISIAISLLCTALSLLVATDAFAQWMAHPARVDANGIPPEATVTGALWLRIALVVVPWCVVLLLALVRRTDPLRVDDAAPVARTSVLALAGIVLVGAVLRGMLLGQSLWYDELVGFGGYSLAGPGAIVGNYYSQANHVLSQLLVWCSTVVLGVDEFSIRLPSFVASLATIVAAFALGREAKNDRVGLLSAASMAVMPIVVLAGTDARGYSLVILGATMATWLGLRARRIGSTATWAIYALVIALTAWAHLVFLVVPLAHGVWCLVDLARGRRQQAIAGLLTLLIAAAITLLLYAPILPDLLALRQQFRTTSTSQPSLLGIETLHAFFGLGGAWTWWAAIPGAILIIVGLPSLRAAPQLRTAIIVSAAAFPLAYAIAAIGHSWLYARFLLFTAPATALLIAAGLDRLQTRGVRIAALAVLVGVSTADVLTLPPRQPLRDALLRAKSMLDAKESVGVIGLRDNPLAYYATVLGVPLVDFGDRGAMLDARLTTTRPRAIIVLYPATLPAERIATLSSQGYVRTETLSGWIDWGAGALELWRRP